MTHLSGKKTAHLSTVSGRLGERVRGRMKRRGRGGGEGGGGRGRVREWSGGVCGVGGRVSERGVRGRAGVVGVGGSQWRSPQREYWTGNPVTFHRLHSECRPRVHPQFVLLQM